MKKITLILFVLIAFCWQSNAQSIVIGTGTDETTSTGSDPIDGYFNSFRYQVVYTAAELSASLTPYDEITSLGWSISGDYGGGALLGYTIKIGHTSATNSAAHDASSTTVVKNAFDYDPSVTAVGVFDMIAFDTNFVWNGTDNILVEVCSDGQNPFSSPYGQVRGTNGTDGSRRYRTDGSTSCGVNTNTSNILKPNIQFDYIDGTPPACEVPTAVTVGGVTDVFAGLTWTDNPTAIGYDIELGAAGFTPGTGSELQAVSVGQASGGIGTSPLTAGTDYDFYIRSNCDTNGFSSWAGPFSFTTLIAGQTCEVALVVSTLPYNTSDDTANYFDDYSGSAGATNCGTTSSYLNGDDVVYAYTATADSTINVAMSVIGSTYSGVFVYDDCANIGTECVAGFGNGNSTNDYDFDVSVTNGTTYYVVISTWASPQSTTYTLDITEILCADPSALTAANITTTTADLGWTENGTAASWNIELGAAGFTPTGTATATSATNAYPATGLTAATSYDFYVQADCGASLSAWVGPYAFTTACIAITPDYTADMSVNVPDSCWDEAGSGELVDGPMNLGASQWKDGRAYTNGGSVVIASNVLNLYRAEDREWLLSPSFDLSTGGPFELQIEVALTDYCFSCTSDATNTASMGSDDEVQLLMSTDGGTSWTNITTWNVGNEPAVAGTLLVEDLTAFTGNVQFALFGSDGIVNDAEDYDFHVGKFVVRAIPGCIEPTALAVSNITSESADFSWTENGPATTWDIELVDITGAGVATGTPTIVATADNPISLTGLAEQNDYEVYVRSICGGDTSAWSGPASFTTPCAAVSMDYAADMTLNVPDACWNEAGAGEVADGPMNLGASEWKANRAYTDLDINVVNSNVMNLYLGDEDREWLISPIFNLDIIGSVGLLVQVAVTDYCGSCVSDATNTAIMGSDDAVQLLMTNDGGTNWTNLTTWNVGNQPAVTGTDYLVDLSAMTGNVQFAFLASDGIVNDVEDYDFHVGKFIVNNAVLSTTEIENEAALKFYPNPVKNTLTLNALNTIENVVMFNMLGQEVLRATPNNIDSDLDMSNLQAGTYFVKVTIANITQTIRVIKQ